MIIQNSTPKWVSVPNTIDHINSFNLAIYEEGGDYYLYDLNNSSTIAWPFRKILSTFHNSFLFEKSDWLFEAYSTEWKKIATINNGSFLRPVALGNYIANIEQDWHKFEVDLYWLKPAVNIKFKHPTLWQPQIVWVFDNCLEISNIPFESIWDSLLHIDFNWNNIDFPEKYKDMTKKMFWENKFFMVNLDEEWRIYDKLTGKEIWPFEVRPYPYFQEWLAIAIEKWKLVATIINENLETIFTINNLIKQKNDRIQSYFFKNWLVVVWENVYNKEWKLVYSNKAAKGIEILGWNDSIKCLTIKYQTSPNSEWYWSCLQNVFIKKDGEVMGQFDSNDWTKNQIIALSKDSAYLTTYDLIDMNTNYGDTEYILKVPLSEMFVDLEQLKGWFFKVNWSYYHLPNLNLSSWIENKINDILLWTKVEMDAQWNLELKGKRFKKKLLKIN